MLCSVLRCAVARAPSIPFRPVEVVFRRSVTALLHPLSLRTGLTPATSRACRFQLTRTLPRDSEGVARIAAAPRSVRPRRPSSVSGCCSSLVRIAAHQSKVSPARPHTPCIAAWCQVDEGLCDGVPHSVSTMLLSFASRPAAPPVLRIAAKPSDCALEAFLHQRVRCSTPPLPTVLRSFLPWAWFPSKTFPFSPLLLCSRFEGIPLPSSLGTCKQVRRAARASVRRGQ